MRTPFCSVLRMTTVLSFQGASILLMVNSTLKDGEFQKGVVEYLKKFRNRNTVNEDLWNSLSSVT